MTRKQEMLKRGENIEEEDKKQRLSTWGGNSINQSNYQLNQNTLFKDRSENKILRSIEDVNQQKPNVHELDVFKKVVDSYSKKISNLKLKIESEKRQIKNIKNRTSQDFQNRSK